MAEGAAQTLVPEPRGLTRSRLERISLAVAKANSYSPRVARPSKLQRSLDGRGTKTPWPRAKAKHRIKMLHRKPNSSAPNLEKSRSGEEALNAPSAAGPKSAPLGVGGWIAVVALVGVLGASVWFAFYGWNLTDAKVSTSGMISLALGVVISMVLGGGLMALVFWSNKKGYDG